MVAQSYVAAVQIQPTMKMAFVKVGFSTGSALEDNESMTHKSNKAHRHNNKQVKRESHYMLPNRYQPLTLI